LEINSSVLDTRMQNNEKEKDNYKDDDRNLLQIKLRKIMWFMSCNLWHLVWKEFKSLNTRYSKSVDTMTASILYHVAVIMVQMGCRYKQGLKQSENDAYGMFLNEVVTRDAVAELGHLMQSHYGLDDLSVIHPISSIINLFLIWHVGEPYGKQSRPWNDEITFHNSLKFINELTEIQIGSNTSGQVSSHVLTLKLLIVSTMELFRASKEDKANLLLLVKNLLHQIRKHYTNSLHLADIIVYCVALTLNDEIKGTLIQLTPEYSFMMVLGLAYEIYRNQLGSLHTVTLQSHLIYCQTGLVESSNKTPEILNDLIETLELRSIAPEFKEITSSIASSPDKDLRTIISKLPKEVYDADFVHHAIVLRLKSCVYLNSLNPFSGWFKRLYFRDYSNDLNVGLLITIPDEFTSNLHIDQISESKYVLRRTAAVLAINFRRNRIIDFCRSFKNILLHGFENFGKEINLSTCLNSLSHTLRDHELFSDGRDFYLNKFTVDQIIEKAKGELNSLSLEYNRGSDNRSRPLNHLVDYEQFSTGEVSLTYFAKSSDVRSWILSVLPSMANQPYTLYIISIARHLISNIDL